jgi:hypothetical protein
MDDKDKKNVTVQGDKAKDKCCTTDAAKKDAKSADKGKKHCGCGCK